MAMLYFWLTRKKIWVCNQWFYPQWQLSAQANVIVNPKGTAEFYTSKWSVTFTEVKREWIYHTTYFAHRKNGEK